ncbi:hypothetical protein E2562_003990 [Oryza meyeriana var. granulata]|uniref:Glucan endo-1,3-beta-D-glucosidase n=1 Tax=Oryza meyeriana var. granulata TaxID=110450 RepID=A0A6G1BJ79_9ORYZ|nr:hypothetical protein E2562_003990 [Oryza meyeriana var. granulata]
MGAWAALLALLLALSAQGARSAEAAVGVNWGTVSSVVVDLLRTNQIGKVKLFDADPAVLRALAGNGIQVLYQVNKVLLPMAIYGTLAKNISTAVLNKKLVFSVNKKTDKPYAGGLRQFGDSLSQHLCSS